MFLKPTNHKALHPLKMALEERVRNSPIKHGVGKRVMEVYGRKKGK